MNSYKFFDINVGLEESFSVRVNSEKLDQLVHGMLTSSFFSTLVGVYLPGKYCILQGVDIQFSIPVYIDDILTITGKVSYINEAYKQLEIKAVIINQDNKKVSKATIKVGVMDE